MLHELGPDGAPRVDPKQATDVARWRKAERERLMSARMALASDIRAAQTLAMIRDLDSLVASARSSLVSVYWPIRCSQICARGCTRLQAVAFAWHYP